MCLLNMAFMSEVYNHDGMFIGLSYRIQKTPKHSIVKVRRNIIRGENDT